LEAAHWPAPPEAGDPSTRLQTIRTALPTALAKPAALRDYHIAHSEQAGWLWVYRERLQAGSGMERWFLHGRFA
jgi:protein ImuB